MTPLLLVLASYVSRPNAHGDRSLDGLCGAACQAKEVQRSSGSTPFVRRQDAGREDDEDWDDTAVIVEVGYSLTTSSTMELQYRVELSRSMGEENDAIFLTHIYYGL